MAIIRSNFSSTEKYLDEKIKVYGRENTQYIELENQTDIYDSTIRKICDFPNLITLTLKNCKLDNNDLSILRRYVITKEKLTSIDLTGNTFSMDELNNTAGYLFIINTFACNLTHFYYTDPTTKQTLDLVDEVRYRFAQFKVKNITLQSNPILNDHVRRIVLVHTLEQLTLSDVGLDDKSLKMLIPFIKNNKNLNFVDLSNNNFSNQAMNDLAVLYNANDKFLSLHISNPNTNLNLAMKRNAQLLDLANAHTFVVTTIEKLKKLSAESQDNYRTNYNDFALSVRLALDNKNMLINWKYPDSQSPIKLEYEILQLRTQYNFNMLNHEACNEEASKYEKFIEFLNYHETVRTNITNSKANETIYSTFLKEMLFVRKKKINVLNLILTDKLILELPKFLKNKEADQADFVRQVENKIIELFIHKISLLIADKYKFLTVDNLAERLLNTNNGTLHTFYKRIVLSNSFSGIEEVINTFLKNTKGIQTIFGSIKLPLTKDDSINISLRKPFAEIIKQIMPLLPLPEKKVKPEEKEASSSATAVTYRTEPSVLTFTATTAPVKTSSANNERTTTTHFFPLSANTNSGEHKTKAVELNVIKLTPAKSMLG